MKVEYKSVKIYHWGITSKTTVNSISWDIRCQTHILSGIYIQHKMAEEGEVQASFLLTDE